MKHFHYYCVITSFTSLLLLRAFLLSLIFYYYTESVNTLTSRANSGKSKVASDKI